MIQMSRVFPLLLALASAATAQQSMVDGMNRRFASQSPKAGETLPDATGFTMAGEPFALKDTRGKLAVLVTGCLT